MVFSDNNLQMIADMDLFKANLYTPPKFGVLKPRAKSVFVDPTNVMSYVGARVRPSYVSQAVLRHMARACKPVRAIINTRMAQVSKFADIPKKKTDLGFKITLRDVRKKPSTAAEGAMHELELFFLRTGWKHNPNRPDDFVSYLKKIVNDSLTIDAVCTELIPDQKGDIAEFRAVDGGLIKSVDVNRYEPRFKYEDKGRENQDEVRFVLEWQGEILAEFTADELAYGIRNPRTEVEAMGYGYAETEQLIETITGMLYAESYNSKYFSQNSVPQGVLNVVGKYDDEELENFKRAWQTQVSGVVNAWKTPMFAMEDGKGVSFTPFKMSSKDMEYHQWIEFLIKVCSAVYLIDPKEINFSTYGAGGAPLIDSSGKQASEGLKFSQDKGLMPILQFLANYLNKYIVDKINPDFKFEWTGLDVEDELKKTQIQTAQINSYRTINEIRKEQDLEEFDADWANIPMNASVVSMYQQDKNMVLQRNQQLEQQNFADEQMANEKVGNEFSQKDMNPGIKSKSNLADMSKSTDAVYGDDGLRIDATYDTVVLSALGSQGLVSEPVVVDGRVLEGAVQRFIEKTGATDDRVLNVFRKMLYDRGRFDLQSLVTLFAHLGLTDEIHELA